MDEPAEFNKHVAGSLMELRICGVLAGMFYFRRVVPTGDEWLILKGDADLTMRDVGEISGRLGFDLHIEVISNQMETPR